MNNPQIDLSQLSLDRSTRDSSPRPLKRKWISRYVIPVGILLGFVFLIFVAAGQSFWPKPSVEVIPVIVKRAAVQQSGTPLFRAAGWVEPCPMAINVPALAPGVIDELLVVEGQAVKKAEPIARLVSIDAEIAVKQAQAIVATAEGQLKTGSCRAACSQDSVREARAFAGTTCRCEKYVGES